MPLEGVAIRWHQEPYRGLLSFEFEHASVFFGRTRARNEIRELLARQVARGNGCVLMLGASGSGKSSLVKAGLLPDLLLPGMIGRAALVRWALIRPSDTGGDLTAALAATMLSPTALPELAGLRYTPHRSVFPPRCKKRRRKRSFRSSRALSCRQESGPYRDRRSAVGDRRRSARRNIHD